MKAFFVYISFFVYRNNYLYIDVGYIPNSNYNDYKITVCVYLHCALVVKVNIQSNRLSSKIIFDNFFRREFLVKLEVLTEEDIYQYNHELCFINIY